MVNNRRCHLIQSLSRFDWMPLILDQSSNLCAARQLVGSPDNLVTMDGEAEAEAITREKR